MYGTCIYKFPHAYGISTYTQLQKKCECFKIGIVSRKWLQLKPKCPRYDDNAPELYLLKKNTNAYWLLTSGCCINTSSKTANLIMLGWFIEIAIMWEGVITNSQKPLILMAFCNYQAWLKSKTISNDTIRSHILPSKQRCPGPRKFKYPCHIYKEAVTWK